MEKRLLIKFDFCFISVRPLRLHFVDENAQNGTAEIRRLELERDNIQTHLPEQLRNSNIQVEYHGIFSMCDGKVEFVKEWVVKSQPSFFRPFSQEANGSKNGNSSLKKILSIHFFNYLSLLLRVNSNCLH